MKYFFAFNDWTSMVLAYYANSLLCLPSTVEDDSIIMALWPTLDRRHDCHLTCGGRKVKSQTVLPWQVWVICLKVHQNLISYSVMATRDCIASRGARERRAMRCSRASNSTLQGAAGRFRVLQTPLSRTWQSPAANLRPSIWKSRYLSAHSRRFYSGLIVLFCPEWMQGLQRPATGFCSATSTSAKHIWRS